MIQIICQSGSQKCLYVNETQLCKIRENIRNDFQDVQDFQMMYVDQQNGQWLIVSTQNDLRKIIQLNKDIILFKILPCINRQKGAKQSNKKIGKIKMNEQLIQMVQFISKKYIQRFIQKQLTYKMMSLSEIMLQQKIPPSRTKFSEFSMNTQEKLSLKKPKRNIERISLQKNMINRRIQNSIKQKFKQSFQILVQQCYSRAIQQIRCRKCQQDQKSVLSLINTQMLQKYRKIKSKINKNMYQ